MRFPPGGLEVEEDWSLEVRAGGAGRAGFHCPGKTSLRETQPPGGCQRAQQGDAESGRPQANVAGGLGHLRPGGSGHWVDKSRVSPHPGFCSALVTSRGREGNGLGSGFDSLLQGFLLTFLTQICSHTPSIFCSGT